MIRVSQLTKRYGAVLAVDNISFDIEKGGVVGFLGPNGAGKTTTIRILTCYHPATSGAVHIDVLDVFKESIEVRRRIGYLSESTPLYPEMRVREYLQFRGKLRGLTSSERTVAIKRASQRCWLGEFINRPIGQLSKGMRQRVGLADAMMHNPEVLILDEPTVGLDPTQIRETRNLIEELGQEHTVLLSSHILHEVEQVCTHTMIIAAGKIVASGSPKELREQFSAQGKIVAEMRGPKEDVESGVRALNGVKAVEASSDHGWMKVSIESEPGSDVREDIFKLASAKGWSLREIRRDGATLEDFFIKVTAQQQSKSV